jgi:hypothetical protein
MTIRERAIAHWRMPGRPATPLADRRYIQPCSTRYRAQTTLTGRPPTSTTDQPRPTSTTPRPRDHIPKRLLIGQSSSG